MPEVTVRRRGEIIRAVFSALLDAVEGLPAGVVISQAAEQLDLTPYEQGTYSGGTRRFDKIARFATIPTVKAGWLVKSKGRWTLTDEGREAYATYSEPEQLIREAVARYREWRRHRVPATPESVDVLELDEETADIARATVEEADDAAWREIEAYIAAMAPYDFQELVAALLRGMGYHVAYVSPPGPDRGVDIFAFTDPLGVEGPRIKVQVKRLTGSKVDVDGVRAFLATLAVGDAGIFVATGGFTSAAEREARFSHDRRLRLLDLADFFRLWVEHYARVPEDKRVLLPLRPVHFLALPD